ncbi:MAG TPA: response regulator [Candidatus Eisenbacteria bacterium]|nr:response regulator [Candidatus Eisenbacteria bacterium]
MSARSILIVDDDERLRSRLARAFTDRGYTVYEAADVASATAVLRDQRPERVVVDLRLGAESGLELVGQALALNPAARLVVLTGYGSIATALEAVHRGATHYLTKPADADDIERAFTGVTHSPPGATDEVPIPSLARVEWEHINRVLADSGGNISEAARRLGLHRRSLQRKLAKYPTRR